MEALGSGGTSVPQAFLQAQASLMKSMMTYQISTRKEAKSIDQRRGYGSWPGIYDTAQVCFAVVLLWQ
jgi:hypothetical protein